MCPVPWKCPWAFLLCPFPPVETTLLFFPLFCICPQTPPIIVPKVQHELLCLPCLVSFLGMFAWVGVW